MQDKLAFGDRTKHMPMQPNKLAFDLEPGISIVVNRTQP